MAYCCFLWLTDPHWDQLELLRAHQGLLGFQGLKKANIFQDFTAGSQNLIESSSTDKPVL